MRDKRPVDELSIEELERILALRKREARLARLRRYEGSGRIVAPDAAVPEHLEKLDVPEPAPQPVIEVPLPGPQAASAQEAAPDVYYEDEPRFEDELNARRRPQVPDVKGQRLRVLVWNRVLMLIEIAAVFALVFLGIGLFQSLQAVTQVSADMQAQYQATANARLVPPTATPVININAIVLPVGHTFSINAQGTISTTFNLDEVPAQYREQYVTLMSEPPVLPTVSPEGPINISIPKIKVAATVVEGDSWGALQLGVGHHLGSANPGQRGNMVLSGHNDVYGETFRELDKLQPGDQVIVSTMSGTYTYVVQNKQFVSPTDLWVMEPQGDAKIVTLISCYPYRVDTRRIVVFGALQS